MGLTFQLHSMPGKLLPHGCGFVLLNLKTKCLFIMTVIMTADGKACLKSTQEVSVSVPGARVLQQCHSAWGLSLAHCLSQRQVNGDDVPTSQMTLSSPARRAC